MSLKSLAEIIILRNQRCNSSEDIPGHSGSNAAVTVRAIFIKKWASPQVRVIQLSPYCRE
jgi:hypothetical protein